MPPATVAMAVATDTQLTPFWRRSNVATIIEIDYTREFQNADVQAVISRGNSTTDVMVQLGPNYQSMPDVALVPYQNELIVLAGKVTLLNSLVDQIRPLLVDIDALTQPLHEKNIRALGMLRAALRNDADIALLDQITGPTPQPPSPPTPPGP